MQRVDFGEETVEEKRDKWEIRRQHRGDKKEIHDIPVVDNVGDKPLQESKQADYSEFIGFY